MTEIVAVPIFAGSVTTACEFPATGAAPPGAHAVRRSADAASAPTSFSCLDIEILRFLVACFSEPAAERALAHIAAASSPPCRQQGSNTGIFGKDAGRLARPRRGWQRVDSERTAGQTR